MNVEGILIDNFREGLRVAQRYINLSLGASVTAFLYTVFNKGETVPFFGVKVPATVGFWLSLLVFWGTGIMALHILTRVTKNLDLLGDSKDLVVAAISVPVFITSPNPAWRYTPTALAPIIALIALIVSEGFPSESSGWNGFVFIIAFASWPFAITVNKLRIFNKLLIQSESREDKTGMEDKLDTGTS